MPGVFIKSLSIYCFYGRFLNCKLTFSFTYLPESLCLILNLSLPSFSLLSLPLFLLFIFLSLSLISFCCCSTYPSHAISFFSIFFFQSLSFFSLSFLTEIFTNASYQNTVIFEVKVLVSHYLYSPARYLNVRKSVENLRENIFVLPTTSAMSGLTLFLTRMRTMSLQRSSHA